LFWHYKIPPLYFWLFSNLEVDIAGNAIVGIFQVVSNCAFLPKAQPKMALSGLHISYFIQNCKKGKPIEIDLP
jgi:hypothetical protein